MEKDNKCMPMKVYSSTLSYPLDTKTKGTQQTTNKVLSGVGMISVGGGDPGNKNEIIDLTLTAPPTAANSNKNIDSSNLCNINAKARSYELQKINNKMINIYDESQTNVQIATATGMMPGFSSCPSNVITMASTSGAFNQKDQLLTKDFVVSGLDILHGISNGEYN